jgi:hypothetical protein
MMNRIALVSIALALGPPTIGLAQQRPDFSGTWKLTSTQPGDYQGMVEFGVPSPTIRITQTASDVTIEASQYGLTGLMKVSYRLDGTDTIWDAPWVPEPKGQSTQVKWRTKARWDASRLVLFTWNTANRQMRDILSLEGDRLTIARALERPQPTYADGTLTYSRAK